MLNQPTIDKLCAMRMRGMAEALQQQMQEPDIHQLSFEERLGLLIDRQWDWRQNRALERRLRNARLQGPACVEDIDYRTRTRSGSRRRALADPAIGLGRSPASEAATGSPQHPRAEVFRSTTTQSAI